MNIAAKMVENKMSTIGERIAQAIEYAGLKQVDLQKACGVSSGMTSQWVKGDVGDLMAFNAVKLAQVCGVRIEWLVLGEGDMEIKPVKDFTYLRQAITNVVDMVFEKDVMVSSNRIADAIILNYKELLAERNIPVEAISNLILLDDHR